MYQTSATFGLSGRNAQDRTNVIPKSSSAMPTCKTKPLIGIPGKCDCRLIITRVLVGQEAIYDEPLCEMCIFRTEGREHPDRAYP